MKTIKRIRDIDTAIDIYLNQDRIGNREIKRLFGCCDTTAIKLKKLARERESKDKIVSPSSTTVSAVSAYKAWGVDIKDLIKRYKLKQEFMKGTPK
jgi:hypothetical protein